MTRCFAAILIVLSGCAVAPGTHVPPPPLGAPETLPRSGQTIDPVCGMKVDDTTSWREDYAGMEYLFHSRECREDFRSNPEAFVGNPRHPQYSRAFGSHLVLDPVCGREVEVNKAQHVYFGGKPLYFHADECRRWFLADPTTYLDEEGNPREFTAR
jgi:YHS domain-containing protein